PPAREGDRPYAFHERRRRAPPTGRAHRRCVRRGTQARRGTLTMHLKLDLALQFGRFPNATAHRAILRKPRVTEWMEAALRHPGEIGVRIVGEEEARALNLQYRARDYAT